VNYKRKLRCRFFLLMRWRTPPISSEFQGRFEPPKPLPSVRYCLWQWAISVIWVGLWAVCGQITVIYLTIEIVVYCYSIYTQFTKVTVSCMLETHAVQYLSFQPVSYGHRHHLEMLMGHSQVQRHYAPSSMESGCKCIEWDAADKRKWVSCYGVWNEG